MKYGVELVINGEHTVITKMSPDQIELLIDYVKKLNWHEQITEGSENENRLA